MYFRVLRRLEGAGYAFFVFYDNYRMYDNYRVYDYCCGEARSLNIRTRRDLMRDLPAQA